MDSKTNDNTNPDLDVTADFVQQYREMAQNWQKGTAQYVPSGPWNVPPPCPSCGRCPTCGKGGYQTRPTWPYYPGTTWI